MGLWCGWFVVVVPDCCVIAGLCWQVAGCLLCASCVSAACFMCACCCLWLFVVAVGIALVILVAVYVLVVVVFVGVVGVAIQRCCRYHYRCHCHRRCRLLYAQVGMHSDNVSVDLAVSVVVVIAGGTIALLAKMSIDHQIDRTHR